MGSGERKKKSVLKEASVTNGIQWEVERDQLRYRNGRPNGYNQSACVWCKVSKDRPPLDRSPACIETVVLQHKPAVRTSKGRKDGWTREGDVKYDASSERHQYTLKNTASYQRQRQEHRIETKPRVCIDFERLWYWYKQKLIYDRSEKSRSTFTELRN